MTKQNTTNRKASRRLAFGRTIALRVLMTCAFGTFALVFALRASAQDAQRSPVAFTESGWVAGTSVNGVDEFLGIPYAAPPVGELRWRPPQPYGHFPGYRLAATQFGSECMQPAGFGLPESGSEDCLFLNVYMPQQRHGDRDWHDRDGRGLPVMVWIHGGGLIDGTGASYDPSELVKQGVIVVTINYRLGYLGFFAQAAIDAEGHLNGNYGLMDQQFALKWVQKNIANFGGDPKQVTIFGQSAGGLSVYSQLASPLAAGLGQRAITESGAYAKFQDYYDYIIPLAQGETMGSAGLLGVPSGAAIADSVGCTGQTAACLRAVPAATLVTLEPSLAMAPFVDGKVLTQTVTRAITSGQFNHVPVISGGTHDEARLYVALLLDFAGNPVLTPADYQGGVTYFLGSALEPAVLQLYPYANYQYGGEALGAATTDGFFACPQYNAVNALAQYVPTYAYEFNDENAPPSQAAFGGLLTFPLGAYHTAELQYLFHINDAVFFAIPQEPLSPEQQELSVAMIDYWTQFAKTGNPNSPDQPYWPAYHAWNNSFQSLVPPMPQVETDYNTEHMCTAFWNTF
jgi:para-nitrobenzyl esterase